MIRGFLRGVHARREDGAGEHAASGREYSRGSWRGGVQSTHRSFDEGHAAVAAPARKLALSGKSAAGEPVA